MPCSALPAMEKGVSFLATLRPPLTPPDLQVYILCLIIIIMQIAPRAPCSCTAMPRPTAHCPHRRIFQVVFGNRDGFFSFAAHVSNSVYMPYKTLTPHKSHRVLIYSIS